MANDKSTLDSAAKTMGEKPKKSKRAVKTGLLLAAAGLTALAIAKGMKSRKGKAAAKKAKAGVRKTVRKVKSKARTAVKRATTGTRRKTSAR